MREHCWHSGSVVYCSYPPQWDEKCCHCGKTRRVRQEFVYPEGHGPYAGEIRFMRDVPEDAGPCEEKSDAR